MDPIAVAATHEGAKPQIQNCRRMSALLRAFQTQVGHYGSSNARRRNPPQDVPENAGLHLKSTRGL
jgi:hypothetical protein